MGVCPGGVATVEGLGFQPQKSYANALCWHTWCAIAHLPTVALRRYFNNRVAILVCNCTPYMLYDILTNKQI